MSIRANLKYPLIRAAFEVLALPGLSNLLRKRSRCKGVIFALHRVLPETPPDFSPNAILQITPQFLKTAITQTRNAGFDIVDLDEAMRRVGSDKSEKPFVVFTFDDAYRDNLVYALPILRALKCPFTLYVPTAFADGVGQVWWLALEDIISRSETLALQSGDELEYIQCKSLNEKCKVYDDLYCRMRRMPEDDRVSLLKDMAWRAGLDLEKHCRDLIMTWPEIQQFAAEPLCTIGAHTVHHYELSKLSPERARSEIGECLRVLEIQLGSAPKHFSYPIGSRVAAGAREYNIVSDFGFRTATTTIPGGLYERHKQKNSSLPRVSLNGYFQESRFMSVFLSGLWFSLIGRN